MSRATGTLQIELHLAVTRLDSLERATEPYGQFPDHPVLHEGAAQRSQHLGIGEPYSHIIRQKPDQLRIFGADPHGPAMADAACRCRSALEQSARPWTA